MWASGTMEAHGPLVVGVPATRTSLVLDAKHTQGRSGSLVVVRVEHRYSHRGEVRITEEQTLVYRQAGPPMPAPVGADEPEISADQWHERHTVGAATLFRFSAVTFNSHRIHYDQPYATTVEGYPALVVHGPLTALMVGEAIRRQFSQRLRRFEFRATAPLFADAPFTIVGSRGHPVLATVVRNDGVEAMTIAAKLDDEV
jgi:hydroxyacyl-ACP dehydratase HTD2-like protein with hotdog domain